MEQHSLIPHLFRTEFRKIVSVLGKYFGMEHLDAAEDIASETFVSALNTWPYKGMPDNPSAWLYAVAKNKAKNYLHRVQFFDENIANEIKKSSSGTLQPEIDLSGNNISDSQLQMLFALCHPAIPVEAQIGLSLRILCGFGIYEIANAFLTNKETINKRLYRAKEKLREEKVKIEFPTETEVDKRLDTVLRTLYLMYNEGYYSESQDAILRENFCLEAMRLTNLLLENPRTNQPPVNALMALMCFHASRFPARKAGNGEIVLYHDQDENLWNHDLIAKGSWFLKEASGGKTFSKYHLEASIAYWHTIKEDTTEKWESILYLYNLLLQVEYSPIAALNRTYALSKVKGKEEAIKEAEKLQLNNNHYYFTLLGTLYTESDHLKAINYLKQAYSIARTIADKKIINDKIEALRLDNANKNQL